MIRVEGLRSSAGSPPELLPPPPPNPSVRRRTQTTGGVLRPASGTFCPFLGRPLGHIICSLLGLRVSYLGMLGCQGFRASGLWGTQAFRGFRGVWSSGNGESLRDVRYGPQCSVLRSVWKLRMLILGLRDSELLRFGGWRAHPNPQPSTRTSSP